MATVTNVPVWLRRWISTTWPSRAGVTEPLNLTRAPTAGVVVLTCNETRVPTKTSSVVLVACALDLAITRYSVLSLGDCAKW